jgi:hypothetical protein
MKLPRLRLADLMFLVFIAALGFAAYRAIGHYELLLAGALPMTSVLAVAWLVGRRRRGGRRFLVGFEAFGAAAVVLYIAVLGRSGPEVLAPYLELAPLASRAAGALTTPRLLLAYAVLSLWISVPQLALAMVGGLLVRSCRIR